MKRIGHGERDFRRPGSHGDVARRGNDARCAFGDQRQRPAGLRRIAQPRDEGFGRFAHGQEPPVSGLERQATEKRAQSRGVFACGLPDARDRAIVQHQPRADIVSAGQ